MKRPVYPRMLINSILKKNEQPVIIITGCSFYERSAL